MAETGTFESWLADQEIKWDFPVPLRPSHRRLAEAAYHAGAAGERERLEEYLDHLSHCVRTRYEQGRPTADGGYECLYAGVWYEARPVDRTPKCNCGLDTALRATPPTGGR